MAFDVGAVVAHLTLDKKQWEQSIAAVKGDQKSLTGFILNNEQQIQKFGKSLTIVGAAITGAFGLLIKGAADAGDYINDLSIRTGIGAETLSAYKLAADKSGTSLEGLGTGMRGLANQMQSANDGGKESQRIFDSLGITYVDNAGKLRPLDEVMLDVADRFAGMEDGAEKTALAQDIFGKSGMELIPMLNMGRKGLEENAEAARKLGIVWSQEAAAKAAEFNDSMAELKAGLAGTGREIATALMPTVKALIENVRDIAVKVREWVAEHPTLTSWIAKLTLGMGALAGLVGPMVMILPKLAQGWHLVAVGLERANLAKTAMGALWTVALGLTAKYVTAQIDLAKAQDYAAEAGGRLHETEDKLVDRLSEAAVAAGWQFGRMSKLIEAYDGNIAALSMAIQKGKEGKDIQEALAKVSEKDADAYDKWRKSIEGVTGAHKTFGDTLKEYGILLIGDKSQKVTELLVLEGQLTELYKRGKIDSMEYGKGIQKIHEELKNLGSTTQTHVLPPVKEFQDLIKKAPGQFSDVTFKAFDFEDALKGVADQAMVSENTVLAFLYNIRAQFLQTMGIMVPEWEGFSGAAKTACKATKGFMDEVSTVVADSMREIARSIAGLIDFKKLFGAAAKEIKFDSKPFDVLVDAAEEAYDKIRGLADDEFDDGERRIRRQEEDEDRRYRNEHDLRRKSIIDSGRSEEEKEAMLTALEIQYEEEKLARERKREDDRYARERAQKAKLLQMEKDHKRDMDKIKADEDKAREKLAADEEKRQKSLWFKIKGIVATAAEEMLVIANTKFFDKVNTKWGDIKDAAAIAFGEVALSLGSAFTGMLSGATTFKEGLDIIWDAIKTAFFSLVTKLITKWTEDFIAKLITGEGYEALSSIVTFFSSAGGGAGGGGYGGGYGGGTGNYGSYAGTPMINQGAGTSRETNTWLKAINENAQLILGIAKDTLANLDDIRANYWPNLNRILDELHRMIDGWLRSIDGRCGDIARAFGDLKSAAGGAVSTTTELVMVHGTPANPEYIIPTDKLGAISAAAPASGEGKSVVVNFTQEIHFDGQFISDKDFTRGRIIPELREAFKSGAWKAEIQQALGVA